jgi:hypothetical protein
VLSAWGDLQGRAQNTTRRLATWLDKLRLVLPASGSGQ